MTGPTDPALRALHARLEELADDMEAEAPTFSKRLRTIWREEYAALAAAEATPLHHEIGTDPDCEWCQKFIAKTHPYEAGADNVCIHCGVVGSYGHMAAALRSPDTETAECPACEGQPMSPDCAICGGSGNVAKGFQPDTETADRPRQRPHNHGVDGRLWQDCPGCDDLASRDTETAGEAES